MLHAEKHRRPTDTAILGCQRMEAYQSTHPESGNLSPHTVGSRTRLSRGSPNARSTPMKSRPLEGDGRYPLSLANGTAEGFSAVQREGGERPRRRKWKEDPVRVLMISMDRTILNRRSTKPGDTLERHIRYGEALKERYGSGALTVVVRAHCHSDAAVVRAGSRAVDRPAPMPPATIPAGGSQGVCLALRRTALRSRDNADSVRRRSRGRIIAALVRCPAQRANEVEFPGHAELNSRETASESPLQPGRSMGERTGGHDQGYQRGRTRPARGRTTRGSRKGQSAASPCKQGRLRYSARRSRSRPG